jgi:hypothetical protein
MCRINQALVKEVDEALGLCDTSGYNRYITSKSGEKELQRLLQLSIDLRGSNSLEAAYVHHALGLAGYSQAMSDHSWRAEEHFRRGDKHFVEAASIYKCRSASLELAADHDRLLQGWARATRDEQLSLRLKMRACDVTFKAMLIMPSASDCQCQAARSNQTRQNRYACPTTPAPYTVPAARPKREPLIEQAVAAGLADLREREEAAIQNLEEDHARQLRNSVERAKEIIAGIPEIIRSRTADKLSYAPIMELEPLESAERPGSVLATANSTNKILFGNGNNLRYAARLVYDYCQRMGLKPDVFKASRNGEDFHHFVLRIHWDAQSISQ